jgi:hypothetical protein
MVMVLGGSGTANGITSFSDNATFLGALGITGALTQSSGAAFNLASGQLVFPATQNASSNANTLDDYEEGTWSPTITQSVSNPTGITYARQQGIYIKVGTLVFLSFNLYITAITNGSGNIRISNFPFTAGNVSEGDRAGMTINYCSGFTSTSCPTGGIVINNSTSIDLTTSDSADARNGRSTYCTNTGSSINLYGTIMYRASA